MNELAFKVLVALWVIFAALGIWLLFQRGHIAGFVSWFQQRLGPAGQAVGYVVFVLLVPVLISIGPLVYLYSVTTESKTHQAEVRRHGRTI